MGEHTDSRPELRRAGRLLREIERRSGDAAGSAVQHSVTQYNRVLQRLEELDAIPAGLFLPLAEDAAPGELGAAAAYLAAYLEDEAESGSSPGAVPEGEPEVGRMQGLGEILRSALPGWIREERPGEADKA